MITEQQTPFFKKTWFLGGIAALAIFVLCFFAIDYVGSPDEPSRPDVEEEVIATLQTNEPLIAIARQQGWIEADATEMTSVDAVNVDSIGLAFSGSNIQSFSEFRYFISVKEIPAGAFAHADQLKQVVVPAGVVTIEYGAFADCPSLEDLQVDSANTHYDSRQDCHGIISTWKGKLMLVAGCKSTVMPDDVRYLAPQAFAGCTALQKVTFPERMEEIGEEAFRGCTALKEVEIPQGVRFVEAGTFSGCSALQSVSLSKSVERLREGAFSGCTSLAKIVTPKRYPPIVENAFDAFTATVYVPQGQLNTYYRDKVWKNFQNIKELP
ncbi:MAG: leucine-rich repeat domain-containing protein [Prevotella sp.]|nr:leucine-rich repeat domain-containing protein [Prevotella sp.]